MRHRLESRRTKSVSECFRQVERKLVTERKFKAKLRRHIRKLLKENPICEFDFEHDRSVAQGFNAALTKVIQFLGRK